MIPRKKRKSNAKKDAGTDTHRIDIALNRESELIAKGKKIKVVKHLLHYLKQLNEG
jgi:hypothetical protein